MSAYRYGTVFLLSSTAAKGACHERDPEIAAILVSDAVGYSRLAAANEERIVARLRAFRSDLIDPTISLHHGRIVKRTGDGSIIEFNGVVDAVRCAIEVQRAMVERNGGVAADKRIQFRIGIHLGDIVEESDGDLMGDGVNIAARLEGVCESGGVCLSEDARQVRDRLTENFVDLGERQLTNIARPVRAYALPAAAIAGPKAQGPRVTLVSGLRGGCRKSIQASRCRFGRASTGPTIRLSTRNMSASPTACAKLARRRGGEIELRGPLIPRRHHIIRSSASNISCKSCGRDRR